LLKLRGEGAQDHSASVSTTFTLALTTTAERHPAVWDLLRVCALLQPDAIPEELFRLGAHHLGPQLQAVCRDPLEWNQVIAAACSSSLLSRQPEEQTLSLHRLVQAVLLESLTGEERQLWSRRLLKALEALFPEVEPATEYSTWKQCERLLPHALLCLRADSPQEDAQDSLTLAELSYKAGRYLRVRGRYAEAEPLYLRALRIREHFLGEEDPDMVRSLHHLAEVLRVQSKYAQAESLFQRAIQLGERTLGPEHHQVAAALHSLAFLYWEQGKYSQARSLYQRAARVLEQALGSEHPNLAFVLNSLADLCHGQGKSEQARSLYQRALRIWEQALGPEHPWLAIALTGLAQLEASQGKHTEAEALFQRALCIREQRLGLSHPEAARTLYALALFRKTQGNVSEALTFAQRALSIRSQALGDAHPQTVATRTFYRQLLQEQTYEQEEQPGRHGEEHQAHNTSLPLRKAMAPSSSQNDPLQEFLDTCCELHPLACCRSADLWQAYEQWVEKQQERYPLSRRAFIAQLKQHGCRADRTRMARIWHGITLVRKAL